MIIHKSIITSNFLYIFEHQLVHKYFGGNWIKFKEFEVSFKGCKINNTLDEIFLHFLFSNDLFINCVIPLPL